jgi:catechol 2,3-dioxygenase-like lactoylglutathione lyase family enzyme
VKARYFDHIDLRVKDRGQAQKFYAQLLPPLGFTTDESGERWGAFEATAEEKPPFFGFTEQRAHVPNENRIAFWADTREEVDRIAQIAREAGALNIEGPQVWTEYTPGYYAVFFDDPSGNKLEVCCRGSSIVAE